MHELALAQSILDIVVQYVPAGQAPSVRKVRVRIGRFAGVVPDSLEFCFEAIISETPWAAARLDIIEVAASGMCRGCAAEFSIPGPVFVCPACGSAEVQIASGTELQVAEIELEDKPAGVL